MMKINQLSTTKLTFLLLFVIAFCLRSAYFNQTVQYLQPGTGSDSYFYLQWAEDIVRGNVLGNDVFYALPLYPYFLSLVYLFSGGGVFGLILIQIFIGSLSCGLIYLIGRRLFDNWTGILAAVIASVYAMLIFYDRMILPASLAIFLSLISLWLILEAGENPGIKRWLVAGALSGLCILASASFLLLAAIVFFWIIYEYRKRPRREIFLFCLSFILPVFLIISGVTLRNYLVAKDAVFLTAHSGINFYIGNNPQADGLFKVPPFMRPAQSGLIEDAHAVAEQLSAKKLKASQASDFWLKQSFNFIKSQPFDYLRLIGKKLALFWSGKEHPDDIEYYIFNEKAKSFELAKFGFSLISPLAILGMFLSWPKRKRLAILYLFIFGLMLAAVSFFINSRYRLIAVPYLIIFAGAAVLEVIQKLKMRQYKSFLFCFILFFALYFLLNLKTENASAVSNLNVHYNKAIYFSDQKQYEEAEKEYQSALAVNSRDFMSYLGLGNIFFEKKDFAGAIDNYQRALAVNPYFRDAHFNLGIAFNETGKKEEAIREFKEVLKLRSGDYSAHYNLGRIYQEKGLKESALEEYEQALRIKPDHPEIIQAINEIKKGK